MGGVATFFEAPQARQRNRWRCPRLLIACHLPGQARQRRTLAKISRRCAVAALTVAGNLPRQWKGTRPRETTPTEAELASGAQPRQTRAFFCGGVTCSGKAFVSQCAPEAPIGVTFRQKALRYQRTAQSVLNRGSPRRCCCPDMCNGDWDGGMFPLAPPAARQDQAGQSVVHEFTTGLELNKIAIG